VDVDPGTGWLTPVAAVAVGTFVGGAVGWAALVGVGVLTGVGVLAGEAVFVGAGVAVAVGVLPVVGVGVAQEPNNGMQRKALLAFIGMISAAYCFVAMSVSC